MKNRINILKGPWSRSAFRTLQLSFSSYIDGPLPVVEEYYCPLLNVDRYEAHCLPEQDETPMLSMDHRTWYHDDGIFEYYLHKICEMVRTTTVDVNLCAGGFFEAPNGVRVEHFVRKLYERTRMASERLRKSNPAARILSPSIGDLSEPLVDKFADYFEDNGDLFDEYSLHVLNDSSHQTISRLLATACKCVEAGGPKPVRITRFAVPVAEYTIIFHRNIGDDAYLPMDNEEACQRVRHIFSTVNSAFDDCTWYISGTHKDFYNKDHVRYSQEYFDFWSDARQYFFHPRKTSGWDWYHFCGLVDDKEKAKAPVVATLADMINQINNEHQP